MEVGIMPTCNLLERTREMLRNRPRTISYEDIIKGIGEIEGPNGPKEISIRWLTELASEGYVNPRYTQLQKLHDYLILHQG